MSEAGVHAALSRLGGGARGKRRGRGEGSIRQRADGRWEARIDLGWQDGKRRRKIIYGKTRRAVADQLPKALQAAQAGALVTDERQTVGRYLVTWLTVKQAQLRPRAFASYERTIRAHIEPGLGRVRLARLAPQHVAAWFTTHQANGASARTIRYARNVLRAALNQALRWSLVSRNAAALVEPPRHRAHEIQPLTPEQARALLASVHGHRLGAVVSVAMAIGLRIGEALGLRWADVSFEAGTISVRQALVAVGSTGSTRWSRIRQQVDRIAAAVASAKPGSYSKSRFLSNPSPVAPESEPYELRQRPATCAW